MPAQEMKDVKFCLAFVHDPGAFHSVTKKIMVPGDIKGMKIRPAHATMATFVTQLGGTNVQSSAPEVRDILEKGVAEAVTFPWGSVPLFGIDKVTKYHMDAPLYVTTFAFVFNQRRLQPDVGGAEEGDRRSLHQRMGVAVAAPWADFEHAGIAKIKAEAGHEVYQLTPEQLAEWKKAAEPLKKTWAANVKKAGGDPDAIMKELQGAARESTTRPIDRAAFAGDSEMTAAGICRRHAEKTKNNLRAVSCGTVRLGRMNTSLADGWTVHRFDRMGRGRSSSASSPSTSSSSVLLRNFFGYTIPDAYDFGQLLLGILIFWGIAATSYRGTHITVDLLWANVSPYWQRMIDVFATLVLLFVVTVQTYTLFDKVATTYAANVLDLRPAHADLAILRDRLGRRRGRRAADCGAHLSADLPSRIDEAGRRNVEVGRVRDYDDH